MKKDEGERTRSAAESSAGRQEATSSTFRRDEEKNARRNFGLRKPRRRQWRPSPLLGVGGTCLPEEPRGKIRPERGVGERGRGGQGKIGGKKIDTAGEKTVSINLLHHLHGHQTRRSGQLELEPR